MKSSCIAILIACSLISALRGSPTLDRARQMEASGDPLGARALLAQAAQSAPGDVTALTEYAEFLDLYGDPAAKDAYVKLLAALDGPANRQHRARVARRLAELSFLAGHRADALRYLDICRNAGGNAVLPSPPPGPDARQYVEIPGPLRSFSRMAAISSDAQPPDILPAIARNVVTNGFQASHSNEALEQTEYLKLVHRYVSQARELAQMAGPDGLVHIPSCDSSATAGLLRVLGFRIRGACGAELVLETVNASRAFITTDSGFPLPRLEEALRTNRPFTYDCHPSRVPVLFNADYWMSTREKASGDLLDVLLSDPSLCRLYLGLSKLDPQTADALRRSAPLARLKAYAHVLDFFGAMFEVRDGKAVVPGGARSAAAWSSLVGVPSSQGAAFFEKLIEKDDGWMAAYFDALARIQGPVQDYLTAPGRMQRFYMAIRGKVTSPGPARPVFRANADMMLLTTRLYLDPDGQPHVPGNLQVWKDLFALHPQGKYDARLTRAAPNWKDPDDVLEALFGLTRRSVDNEPLRIFMALSDLDRDRPQPLDPQTVSLLADNYRMYGSQYAIFNDSPYLSGQSMAQFISTANDIVHIKDSLLRADTLGTMQALIGLWQIFARQGSLPPAKADATFAGLLRPFHEVRDDRALFDAGRDGVRLLLSATGSAPGNRPQEQLLNLLAGAANPEDQESHSEIVDQMNRVLEAQRTISLDDILALADQLDSVAQGGQLNKTLVNRLSSRISEIPWTRSTLTPVERNSLSFGYWTQRHIEAERKLNLRAAVEKASGEKLHNLRGLLAPFLRDTLVAYNYAHYTPPGAEVVYTNPLFVRSHDFLGVQGASHMWHRAEVFGTGWPSNGGGRLVGSLAGLPYALAEAEQNFLVPDQTQALIWGDLVPQIMVSAVVPRWWRVTPSQMHWTALHLRYGESLLAESAIDPSLRRQMLQVLASQAVPARVSQVATLLEDGQVRAALGKVTPSELFVLAARMQADPQDPPSPLLREIHRLAAASPDQINYRAISADFGTPKPTLANSYRPELLHLRTFPTLMGYSSRILAESWESNTLYWAELADETYRRPSQLNVDIPEWTAKVVENIFASHLDDWPALLRSLRTVGADVRAQRAKAGSQMAAE